MWPGWPSLSARPGAAGLVCAALLSAVALTPKLGDHLAHLGYISAEHILAPAGLATAHGRKAALKYLQMLGAVSPVLGGADPWGTRLVCGDCAS